MSLRPTLEALRQGHDTRGRLRLYARNVDLATANLGASEVAGFKVVLDPAMPTDRFIVRNNQGELLASVMLPGKD